MGLCRLGEQVHSRRQGYNMPLVLLLPPPSLLFCPANHDLLLPLAFNPVFIDDTEALPIVERTDATFQTKRRKPLVFQQTTKVSQKTEGVFF